MNHLPPPRSESNSESNALQLSDGTEPLPEPMLTYHRGPQLFIPGNVILNTKDINSQAVFEIYEPHPHLPGTVSYQLGSCDNQLLAWCYYVQISENLFKGDKKAHIQIYMM